MLQMWKLSYSFACACRHPFHFISNVSCSQDLLVSFLKMHFMTWKKIKIISNPLSCEVKKRLKPYCSFILYCNPLGEEGGLWQFDLSGNWSIFSADSFIAPESHWWWDQAQNKQAEKSYDFSFIREDGDESKHCSHLESYSYQHSLNVFWCICWRLIWFTEINIAAPVISYTGEHLTLNMMIWFS